MKTVEEQSGKKHKDCVSEKKFGGREGHVVWLEVEDWAGVQISAVHHVVLQMHRAFRKTGAARAVEPKAHIVFARRRRVQFR